MRQPAILALVWICALLMLTGTLTKMPGQWHRRDFSNYYESAWALRHGIDPYFSFLTPVGVQLGLETGGLLHASETPPFLLCFEPLTRLQPRAAFWLWSAINFAALAIAMYLLLAHRPGLSGRTAWLLAGLILTSAPVNVNLYWGQSQLITLALIAAAMRSMERDRDGRCRFADRCRSTAAGLPAVAPRLFCHSSQMARACLRDDRNRGRNTTHRRGFGPNPGSQLRARRNLAD